MRILPVLSAAIAALGLTACTYVERERPAPPSPVVVQPPPQSMAPPPTVTVRPSY
jgi:hypothetical protein